MGKRRKIAIYSGTVPSTTFIERLIGGLAQAGYEILLFGLRTKRTTYNRAIRVVAHDNRWSKLVLLLKYTLLLNLFHPADKRRMDAILKERGRVTNSHKLKFYPVLYHRPEIFHVQWAKSVEDWMWVREFGMKMVVSLRGAHINYSPIADTELASIYKTAFPKIDGFHAVSKAIAKEATKYGADGNKIALVYSGLDLNKLCFQKKEFVAHTTLKILSIGRAHWKKGYSYALKSAFILKSMGVDFKYEIIGVEAYEELLYLRSEFELENEVAFNRELSFKEIIEKIQQADVLLLPSVEEGIANVVLEAMALGTLVVTTNCGGMDEVVVNDENGFIVPIRDPEAMASALKHAAELTIENYQQLTAKARKTIEKHHSNKKMISDMQELYKQVLI